MVPTRRALVLALLGLAVFALLYPFQSTVTNRWLIAAVNVDGHPIAGCQIEQQRQWKAVGLTGQAVLTTDVGGHAIFPPRTVRASLIRRASGLIGSFSFHGTVSGRSVQFLGCDAKGQRAARRCSGRAGLSVTHSASSSFIRSALVVRLIPAYLALTLLRGTFRTGGGAHVDDPTDDTPAEEALTKCEEKIEELKEENAQLRNAAETFGDLAERLNARQGSNVNPEKHPRPAKGGKSQPDKGLSN